MSDNGTPSFLRPDSITSESQALDFYVKLLMGQASHAFLAKVIACTNSGQVLAPGTVDVMPMLNQLRADGTIIPPSPVYGLPYVRVQSGQSAIICDPIPNIDIGIAVVCDRDISSLKNNFDLSNPGSMRNSNPADGIFICLALGQTIPTQYIHMLMDDMGNPMGINIVSTGQPITITASNVTLDAAGNLKTIGEITRGSGTGDQVTLGQHTHKVENVQAGSATIPTDPPTGRT